MASTSTTANPRLTRTDTALVTDTTFCETSAVRVRLAPTELAVEQEGAAAAGLARTTLTEAADVAETIASAALILPAVGETVA